jgi:RNA polymerase subunit RPABC4/transcription elongation factor Spt4
MSIHSSPTKGKFDAKGCAEMTIDKAFVCYIEKNLDTDENWIDSTSYIDPKISKAATRHKSRIRKVMKYALSLLTKEEMEVKNAVRPNDTSSEGWKSWYSTLLALSTTVQEKLMTDIFSKEGRKEQSRSLSTTVSAIDGRLSRIAKIESDKWKADKIKTEGRTEEWDRDREQRKVEEDDVDSEEDNEEGDRV